MTRARSAFDGAPLQQPPQAAVLARVVRSGMIESVHQGQLLAMGSEGEDKLALGDAEGEIFARSSLKPVQVVAILRAGVPLSDEQIAVACASHNGQEQHRAVVRSILSSAALTEADLANTPSLPLDPQAADAWHDAGNGPAAITQNCSGKHAAMLATCVHAGWDVPGYLDIAHPLQQCVLETVTELTGEQIRHVAVDGCGAPQPSTTVRGLARAFARIATAPAETPEYRVATAMRTHPFLIAGTDRDATEAMQAVPGLIAKDGAEGVCAAAMPDGRAVALKVADGASRPRPVLLAAGLRALGLTRDWPWAHVAVLGHGEPVGAVHPAFGIDAGEEAGTGEPSGVGEDAGAEGAG